MNCGWWKLGFPSIWCRSNTHMRSTRCDSSSSRYTTNNTDQHLTRSGFSYDFVCIIGVQMQSDVCSVQWAMHLYIQPSLVAVLSFCSPLKDVQARVFGRLANFLIYRLRRHIDVWIFHNLAAISDANTYSLLDLTHHLCKTFTHHNPILTRRDDLSAPILNMTEHCISRALTIVASIRSDVWIGTHQHTLPHTSVHRDHLLLF